MGSHTLPAAQDTCKQTGRLSVQWLMWKVSGKVAVRKRKLCWMVTLQHNFSWGDNFCNPLDGQTLRDSGNLTSGQKTDSDAGTTCITRHVPYQHWGLESACSYIKRNHKGLSFTRQKYIGSYLVHTEGGLIRRNRTHMRPVLSPLPQEPMEMTDTALEQSDMDTHMHTTKGVNISRDTDMSRAPYVTSSGRVSRPPECLNLWGGEKKKTEKKEEVFTVCS